MRSCEQGCLPSCISSIVTMDGWMICEITPFLTVFQSYQDDGRMIMKGCAQWNPHSILTRDGNDCTVCVGGGGGGGRGDATRSD